MKHVLSTISLISIFFLFCACSMGGKQSASYGMAEEYFYDAPQAAPMARSFEGAGFNSEVSGYDDGNIQPAVNIEQTRKLVKRAEPSAEK